jgi:hypothetical protein
MLTAVPAEAKGPVRQSATAGARTTPTPYGSYYANPRGTGSYNGTGVHYYSGMQMTSGRYQTYSGGFHPYFQGYYGRYSPSYQMAR